MKISDIKDEGIYWIKPQSVIVSDKVFPIPESNQSWKCVVVLRREELDNNGDQRLGCTDHFGNYFDLYFSEGLAELCEPPTPNPTVKELYPEAKFQEPTEEQVTGYWDLYEDACTKGFPVPHETGIAMVEWNKFWTDYEYYTEVKPDSTKLSQLIPPTRTMQEAG